MCYRWPSQILVLSSWFLVFDLHVHDMQHSAATYKAGYRLLISLILVSGSMTLLLVLLAEIIAHTTSCWPCCGSENAYSIRWQSLY